MGGVKLPIWIDKLLYFPAFFIFIFYVVASFVGGFLAMIGILPNDPPDSWIVFSAIVSITVIVVTWRKGYKGPWSNHL